jgi:hypothetical protein
MRRRIGKHEIEARVGQPCRLRVGEPQLDLRPARVPGEATPSDG